MLGRLPHGEESSSSSRSVSKPCSQGDFYGGVDAGLYLMNVRVLRGAFLAFVMTRLTAIVVGVLSFFHAGERVLAWQPSDRVAAVGRAAVVDRQLLEPGVTLRVFQLEGSFDRIPELADGQTPNVDERRPKVDFAQDGFFTLKAPVLTSVRAMLDVPARGGYRFRLTSDDGARLSINGVVVVDHDGRHAATAKESAAVELDGGLHALAIDHFDAGGARRLLLEWKPPGEGEYVVVPEASLLTEIDNARVVAPGVKSLRDDRRPGDGTPIDRVHPSFRVDAIKVEGFRPMVGAMTIVPDGRLIVGTFDPLQRTDTELPDIESKVPDKLYALSGLSGDPTRVVAKVCADGLYEPLGLCAVGDDLYVSHRRAITRLQDLDRDGFYETKQDVVSGWAAWNYHQFTFGLAHKDGKLYAALSTAMAPPGWTGMMSNAAPNDLLRGSVLEVDLSSRTFRAIAGGVRTPNGLGFGPDGSLFYCDNQGTWMPSNQFAEIVPGRFYGHYNNTNFVPQLAERFPRGGFASVLCDRPRTPATIDLVHNDFCNSPTQPVLIETGPYAGQMLVGELTAGGIRRVFLERVNGQWQGAAFQFSQGLSCGVNRLAWGPGGMLVAGGIGAGGNWNWKDTRFGLDRLTPTGITPFEMFAVRAMHDGFEIELTQPVEIAWLEKPENYQVRQWTYRPSSEYGGEKQDIERLKVASAHASPDGKRVSLVIPGLRGGRTVSLRLDPVSIAGEQILSTTAYYTLNHVPAMAKVPALADGVGVGVLPPAGAAVLIGVSALDAFSVNGKTAAAPARTQNEIMGSEYADVGAGDLTTRAWFGDFRLHLEWYAPPGGSGQRAGNSGVYLQDRYEIQILGTAAGTAALQPDEAAAIYKVKAPSVNASTGPGTWQAYDVVFTAPRFSDGKKISPARITLYWNGVLVHDNVEVDAPTGMAAAKGEADAGRGFQVGPIRLQAHATDADGPVRFRNMWIAPHPTAPVRSESTGPASPGPWIELVADGTLDAFEVRGGRATYQLVNGEIIGTSTPNTRNTFLVTKERFGDFELIVEAMQHEELNSGIQIRSNAVTGADGDARAARVVGYQVELDPSPRAFSGGIYDEGRRGWLATLTNNPAARAAFRRGEWNQIQIVARGPLIQTWVNGVPAATVFDALDLEGHIALQVHDVGERQEPISVRWRNIRIRRY